VGVANLRAARLLDCRKSSWALLLGAAGNAKRPLSALAGANAA